MALALLFVVGVKVSILQQRPNDTVQYVVGLYVETKQVKPEKCREEG